MMSQSHGPRIIRHRNARAVSDFQSGLFFYAYGPLYEEIEGEANPTAEANLQFSQSITKEAWNYFVDHASRDLDLMNTIRGDHQNATEQIEREDDEKMIKDYYMSKIGEVVEEAKSVYDGTNIDEMRESRFRFMMINHGCLFLLQMLVFLGLGVNKLRERSTLRSHQLDTLFGSDNNDFEERKIGFTKSAVFPGNQIPLVVLNKLIDTTSFFKKIVLEENWEKPSSSDVLKSVLYDLFLGPVLKTHTQEAKVVDILHALHSRLVGTTTRGDIRFQHRNVDPEALPFIDSRRRNYLNPQRDNQRIPMSATEMYSKGMDFKGVSGMAITEINIKGNPFTNKVLLLPVFTFNEITMYLYTCLKHYENHQGPREKVVNDYLRFLSDIVQYDQDVVLLELKGVIEVDSNEVQNDHEVVEYLREVARDAPLTCTTHHLRTLKLAITHHHLKPWYYNYLINCALFSIVLSILSVIFTILQYFSERSKSVI